MQLSQQDNMRVFKGEVMSHIFISPLSKNRKKNENFQSFSRGENLSCNSLFLFRSKSQSSHRVSDVVDTTDRIFQNIPKKVKVQLDLSHKTDIQKISQQGGFCQNKVIFPIEEISVHAYRLIAFCRKTNLWH